MIRRLWVRDLIARCRSAGMSERALRQAIGEAGVEGLIELLQDSATAAHPSVG
jgi:hypothetical protein